MIILSAHDVAFSYGTDVILKNISFGINEGDRIGIVGVNGAGKSVLFKMINGIISPTKGEIHLSKDKKIGYLEQNSVINSHITLFSEMLFAFSELVEIEEKLSNLTEKMSNSKYSNDEHMRFAKEYTSSEELFNKNGGYEYKSRIKSTLIGMGFSEEKQNESIDTLSGGQKTRLALAKILLSDPDLLMLDEPTNHLDIETVEWLEEYLRNFKKTLLVVSHDRYFLDKVTKITLEIENKEAKIYTCPYTEYVKRKEEERKSDLKHYEIQQKEIARMEAFIENQRRWNRERNIIAAESRMKAIERMDKIDKPQNSPSKVAFKFETGKNELFSDKLLCTNNLSKAYSSKTLFKELSFEIRSKDKIFIYGKNGVGKSTLLKILSGKIIPDSGTFEYAKGIKIGYYDQEHQGLANNKSVIDELWDTYPDKNQSEIRGALARFLFCADDVFKKVEVLSGGEKARLTFAKLMLDEANLLILDEPTNHLDIPSREVLESALCEYDGTIIAVSHDRYFIRKIANRILEINPDATHFEYIGNYDEYIEYVNQRFAKQGFNQQKENFKNDNDYERAKKEKSEKRKYEKVFSDTERKIGETEEKINKLKKQIEKNSTDFLKLSELYESVNSEEKKLEKLYETYEKIENIKF